MIRYLIGIILFLLPGLVRGQDIAVRIFARSAPSTIVFSSMSGSFTISGSEGERTMVGAGEPVVVSKYEEKVLYKTIDGTSKLTDTLFITPAVAGSLFSVRQPANREQPRTLSGRMKISSFPGSLLALNLTDVESYLPGVVRAEAGSRGPEEYFRTQAVIARTYLYRHAGRHMLDGYNLCDDVHCQVYSGIVTDEIITDACLSTKGLVLVDKDSTLIISAFHANCGGQTASSGDVWLSSEPYLVSVHDPYCMEGKPLTWERKIPAGEWRRFLSAKGIPDNRDTLLIPSSGIPVRRSSFIINGTTIPATELRDRFSLKSTLIAIRVEGESVLIRGRGYGHGVGLCQDGARVMAAGGKSFREITSFYYPGTVVVDVKKARMPERP